MDSRQIIFIVAITTVTFGNADASKYTYSSQNIIRNIKDINIQKLLHCT